MGTTAEVHSPSVVGELDGEETQDVPASKGQGTQDSFALRGKDFSVMEGTKQEL